MECVWRKAVNQYTAAMRSYTESVHYTAVVWSNVLAAYQCMHWIKLGRKSKRAYDNGRPLSYMILYLESPHCRQNEICTKKTLFPHSWRSSYYVRTIPVYICTLLFKIAIWTALRMRSHIYMNLNLSGTLIIIVACRQTSSLKLCPTAGAQPSHRA